MKKQRHNFGKWENWRARDSNI